MGSRFEIPANVPFKRKAQSLKLPSQFLGGEKKDWLVG